MEDEKQAKTAFAALLYKQPGAVPFQVALSLFPDTGEALRVSQTWPKDQFVLAEIARFAGEQYDDENKLPTKEDLCKKVWGWLETSAGLMTFDERVKVAKLYAELNEMIKKPEPVKVTNENNTWHVMEIPTYGQDSDWERDLGAQQRALQEQGEREIKGERIED